MCGVGRLCDSIGGETDSVDILLRLRSSDLDTLNRLISLLSFFLRSARPGPALADQRHPGVRVGERDGAAAEGAEGDGERGGHDGGVVVADGGHGAAQERRHDLHLPRIQLQHDAGLEGGGHAADEP